MGDGTSKRIGTDAMSSQELASWMIFPAEAAESPQAEKIIRALAPMMSCALVMALSEFDDKRDEVCQEQHCEEQDCEEQECEEWDCEEWDTSVTEVSANEGSLRSHSSHHKSLYSALFLNITWHSCFDLDLLCVHGPEKRAPLSCPHIQF